MAHRPEPVLGHVLTRGVVIEIVPPVSLGWIRGVESHCLLCGAADLTSDPIGAVQRIYEYHGYCYSDEFEKRMKQWLADNRQHKHGPHRYSMEEYGLCAETVQHDFAGAPP